MSVVSGVVAGKLRPLPLASMFLKHGELCLTCRVKEARCVEIKSLVKWNCFTAVEGLCESMRNTKNCLIGHFIISRAAWKS